MGLIFSQSEEQKMDYNQFYANGFYNQEEKLQNNTNVVIETHHHMERLVEELEIKLSQHSLNLLQEELKRNEPSALLKESYK